MLGLLLMISGLGFDDGELSLGLGLGATERGLSSCILGLLSTRTGVGVESDKGDSFVDFVSIALNSPDPNIRPPHLHF
jgi:hypothetical protein